MYYELIISALISVLCVPITLYLAKKTGYFNHLSEEVLDNLVYYIKNDPETQKAVYSIGLLFGNGVKQGFGISKGSGKFNLENLIVQGIGKMFFGEMQPEEPLNTETGASIPKKGWL